VESARQVSEPDKGMCWLTNLEGYDEECVARLYLRASLSGHRQLLPAGASLFEFAGAVCLDRQW
jgi:hypothetical protein